MDDDTRIKGAVIAQGVALRYIITTLFNDEQRRVARNQLADVLESFYAGPINPEGGHEALQIAVHEIETLFGSGNL